MLNGLHNLQYLLNLFGVSASVREVLGITLMTGVPMIGLSYVKHIEKTKEKERKEIDDGIKELEYEQKKLQLAPIKNSLEEGIRLFDPKNTNDDDDYTQFFKNIKLIQYKDWVKLTFKEKRKAYNLFSFSVCDTLSVNTFQRNLDLISEKIGAKEKEVNRLQINLKNNEVQFIIEHKSIPRKSFSEIKPPTQYHLLLGHDKDYEPVWSNDTNIIVTGTSGAGKSRVIMCAILNYLLNNQGDLYIYDPKNSEFKFFTSSGNVLSYTSEIKDFKALVEKFEEEYNRRVELIGDGYLDLDDYNNKNPNNKLKPYMLLIEEFADISDVYTRDRTPWGPYEKVIRLARKHRYVGGKLLLGTQRPSVDVIIGTLKNNTNLMGMKCINEINSKIVIDEAGCEELEKQQGLIRLDGELIKVYAYKLDNDLFFRNIKKISKK